MADGKGDNILISFAQRLASNEKKHRDRAIKKLRKWLTSKSQDSNGGMSRGDMIKIWKGLHYCMWMSDKPLIQEELASSIASLLQCFQNLSQALLFVDAFFETECREWSLIDQLRLDKFMMLIRQVLRQMFSMMKSHKWKASHIRQLNEVLQKSILSPENKAPDGISYHMADIYLAELDYADTKMKTKKFHMFLEPYCVLLTRLKAEGLRRHIVKRIFMEIRQWEIRRLEALEEMEELEEGDEEPVITPHIQVDYKELADHLFTMASHKDCLTKNRNAIYSLVKKLQDIAVGILPPEPVEDVGTGLTREDIDQAADDLLQFEIELEKTTRKANKEKLKKLKRKRGAIGATDGSSDEDFSDDDYGVGDEEIDVDDEDEDEDDISIDIPDEVPDEVSDEVPDEVSDSEEKVPRKKQKKTPDVVPKPIATSNGENTKNIPQETKSKKRSRKRRKKGKAESMDTTETVSHITENNVLNNVAVGAKMHISESVSVVTQYESSDNHNEIPQTTHVSDDHLTKKSKKKHRKSAQAMASPGVADSVSSEPSETDIAKKRRKKKRKSSENMGDNSKISNISSIDSEPVSENIGLLSSENITPGSSMKHKNKETSQEVNEEQSLFIGSFEDDGVELAETASESLHKKPKGTQKQKKKEDALVSFKKVSKTPPAFVKRVFKKTTTPNTEPKKASKKLVSPKAPGTSPRQSKKKVIFDMEKNQAQDFKSSLMVSPMLPYDPAVKPEQGILRSPVIDFGGVQKKLFKATKRPKASDFF